MRKILMLIPSMAGIGGTERVVHSLTSLLQGADYEVHQASFDSKDAPRHFKSNCPFHALGPIPRLPLVLRPWTYALTAWRLRQLKRRIGIDVTISSLWGADLISVLSGGRDRKIALCHINVVGNRSNRLMMKFLPFVSAVYRHFDRVVAICESLCAELRELYRLSPVRSTYIDNFTDRPRTTPRWPEGDAVQRFVWCGRFSHEKNVRGLLLAWSRFAPTRNAIQLVLVGDGAELEDMKAFANDLGLRTGQLQDVADAQVVFAGRQDDPASFMIGARALLLSSHAEGLPMVILEALSLGTPVLASDCPSGGVRTALLESGAFDPDRPHAENAVAGLLLPVPREDSVESLKVWESALISASEDNRLHVSWCQGALERSRRFSSDAARGKWMHVIESMEIAQ